MTFLRKKKEPPQTRTEICGGRFIQLPRLTDNSLIAAAAKYEDDRKDYDPGAVIIEKIA